MRRRVDYILVCRCLVEKSKEPQWYFIAMTYFYHLSSPDCLCVSFGFRFVANCETSLSIDTEIPKLRPLYCVAVSQLIEEECLVEGILLYSSIVA